MKKAKTEFKCFHCELELDRDELCRCEQCEKSRGFSNDICTICEEFMNKPILYIGKYSLEERKRRTNEEDKGSEKDCT